MMDDSVTAAKNVIVRKIKYYKQKKLNLPNFIRKARQEIMENREEPDEDFAYNELKRLREDRNGKAQPEPAAVMKAEVTS